MDWRWDDQDGTAENRFGTVTGEIHNGKKFATNLFIRLSFFIQHEIILLNSQDGSMLNGITVYEIHIAWVLKANMI